MALNLTELKEKTSSFPDKAGVYLIKNQGQKIIYIGKAKSLKKRVRSYFTAKQQDIKTHILMERAYDIDIIVTQNEYEALILENSLIKQWNPRFNINLKDGKSYPVIRVTKEDFPRVFRTRRIIRDGSEYYGPFPAARQLDLYINLIEKLFPLRKCKGALKKKKNPCLYFHIERCLAPCCGKISKEEYNKNIENIRKLLSGKTGQLIDDLNKQMRETSEELYFEKAAKIRDQIRVISEFTEGQKIVDRIMESRDYIAFHYAENLGTFIILQMRSGAMHGKEVFHTEFYSTPKEALDHFLIQYYSETLSTPSFVFLQENMDLESISRYLRAHLKKNIQFSTVGEESDKKIIQMALENAKLDFHQNKKIRELTGALKELKTVLKMDVMPRRIEGFDVAHLSGQDTVGSMVSFLNGLPEKSSYRYYKIRSLDGDINDVKAIREVVARRYMRLLNEDRELPDLILIDGGKGQVSAAFSALKSLKISSTPLAGLAKKNEEIYLPGEKNPILLPEDNRALRILMSVRNESHRFANSFQKRLRKKRLKASLLEQVKGIGEKTKRKIIKLYGSLENIKRETPLNLAKKAGINIKVAQELIRFLNKEKKSS
jgi:excinuclease ABC subunit C